MKANKIYTGYWYGQILPLAFVINSFQILCPRQNITLKSIITNVIFRPMPVNTGIIPLEMNEVMFHDLTIFPFAGDTVPASIFNVLGGVIDLNGREFHIYRPGQYMFEKLFAENNIDFNLEIRNDDVLRTIFYNYSLVVEIE